MDGWGTTQLIRGWNEIYQELAESRCPPRAAKPSYQEFIAESLAYRKSALFERDAAYWHGQIQPHSAQFAGAQVEPRGAYVGVQQLPGAEVFKLKLARAEYLSAASAAEALGGNIFRCLLAALAL